MMDTNPAKPFLDDFIAQRTSSEEFPDPDETVREIRDGRWPYPFPKTALGQVDQTAASSERSANYM
jgi:hypothetical protein